MYFDKIVLPVQHKLVQLIYYVHHDIDQWHIPVHQEGHCFHHAHHHDHGAVLHCVVQAAAEDLLLRQYGEYLQISQDNAQTRLAHKLLCSAEKKAIFYILHIYHLQKLSI